MFQGIPTTRTDDKTIGRAHNIGCIDLQQLLRGQPIESSTGSPTDVNALCANVG
ncbi:hypothetical protein ACMHYB_47960 [Sorangium sp. So ce1128]